MPGSGPRAEARVAKGQVEAGARPFRVAGLGVEGSGGLRGLGVEGLRGLGVEGFRG